MPSTRALTANLPVFSSYDSTRVERQAGKLKKYFLKSFDKESNSDLPTLYPLHFRTSCVKVVRTQVLCSHSLSATARYGYADRTFCGIEPQKAFKTDASLKEPDFRKLLHFHCQGKNR